MTSTRKFNTNYPLRDITAEDVVAAIGSATVAYQATGGHPALMLLYAANPHLAGEVKTRPKGVFKHTHKLKELAKREADVQDEKRG